MQFWCGQDRSNTFCGLMRQFKVRHFILSKKKKSEAFYGLVPFNIYWTLLYKKPSIWYLFPKNKKSLDWIGVICTNTTTLIPKSWNIKYVISIYIYYMQNMATILWRFVNFKRSTTSITILQQIISDKLLLILI